MINKFQLLTVTKLSKVLLLFTSISLKNYLEKATHKQRSKQYIATADSKFSYSNLTKNLKYFDRKPQFYSYSY